jgi:cytochrome c biogenesis protein CcmG, thiol:disulfide interchange protein DsbE
MKRLLYALPILIVAALVAAFWRGLDPARNPATLPSALVGKEAPAVDLPGLAEGAPRLNLSAFKGELVAVNFFASWCIPCRAEHPYLTQLTREHGVPVIGIAWKDKPADSRAFLAELGDPYRATGTDEHGRTGIDFGITGVPETFLIDQEGIVRYRVAGPIAPGALQDELMAAIAEAKR